MTDDDRDNFVYMYTECNNGWLFCIPGGTLPIRYPIMMLSVFKCSKGVKIEIVKGVSFEIQDCDRV